jgi:putative ABC transport system ATP-binding protein/lipoprotein-releasing system ATP-binding protein
MIKLENVSKTYQVSREHTVLALYPVNLQIQPGEFVIITGRSGSGKTTLLNLMAGLTHPTSGRIWLDGVDLWSISDKQQSALRNQKIGFIFQFPSLLPSVTTLENVALPSIFRKNGTRATAEQRARQLLESVGLSDKLAVYPRQLSAGQQQRIVVARALFNNPQLLLADEPTSDLDEQTEIEIMELFSQIHHQTGITILMVTHSSQLVKYGTRAIQMAQGKIVDQIGE